MPYCDAEVCGTPGYLAPEIIECSMDAGHAGYGTAVDMWATRQISCDPETWLARFPGYCQDNDGRLEAWFAPGSFFGLQMEFRGHHVHAARRLAALLAQETDDDAAYDLGGQLRLLVSGVGGPLRHRERSGTSSSLRPLFGFCYTFFLFLWREE